MDPDTKRVAFALGLAPHPEGGLYRETVRGALRLEVDGRSRAAHTAIYFLLPARTFSALHRVASDEVWHHYDGQPVELHTLDANGAHAMTLLGKDLARGERPQHLVPAAVWQAAVNRGDRHALCGCTVAPGFDFADFEMAARADLVARFPVHAALVTELTRP
jgi:predicted cupin superfamily sugar epimerase